MKLNRTEAREKIMIILYQIDLYVKDNIPYDKQKCQPKEQHEFTIKGVKIMATSKKDTIKKYNHSKK